MARRPAEAGDSSPWLHARLQHLLRVARIGEGDYLRQLPLPELERRLLTLTGARHSIHSAELVGYIGLAKAQISNAIKSLEQAGLITRQSVRAPISLTDRGQVAFDGIMAVIVERNHKLVAGMDGPTQKRFHTTLLELTDRAALILAQEHALSEQRGEIPRSLANPPSRRVHAGLVDDRQAPLMLPTMNALASYLKRSTTLMYKRETGLADFDWQILSHLAEHQQIAQAQLIAMMGRDKAQVGRAIQKLADLGMIVRHHQANRRELSLQLTDAGHHVSRLIHYSELRFNAYLFEEIAPSRRRAFSAGLESIIGHATDM